MFWFVGGKENEFRIHLIRTVHEISRYLSLVRAVFCRVFVVFWCGFLVWIFGREIFYCKKELICCSVLGIFADLLLLCRTG